MDPATGEWKCRRPPAGFADLLRVLVIEPGGNTASAHSIRHKWVAQARQGLPGPLL